MVAPSERVSVVRIAGPEVGWAADLDRRRVALTDGPRLAIWGLDPPRLERELEGPHAIADAHLLPDGGAVVVWRTAYRPTRREMATYQPATWDGSSFRALGDPVPTFADTLHGVSVSSDAAMAAIVVHERACVYELVERRPVTLDGPALTRLARFEGPDRLWTLGYEHRDSGWRGVLVRWRIDAAEAVRESVIDVAYNRGIADFAYDGKDVWLLGESGDVGVLDATSGEARWCRPAHGGRVLRVDGGRATCFTWRREGDDVVVTEEPAGDGGEPRRWTVALPPGNHVRCETSADRRAWLFAVENQGVFAGAV